MPQASSDPTMAVALWLANNARDWVAQTTRELFDAEDITQEIAVIQRHAAATLATEIEEAFTEKHLQISYYLPFIEADDASIAHLDLSAVDYLQIATRIVEDLGCQDHGERGGFCAACGFVRPHVFPCATTGGN